MEKRDKATPRQTESTTDNIHECKALATGCVRVVKHHTPRTTALPGLLLQRLELVILLLDQPLHHILGNAAMLPSRYLIEE